MKIAILSAYYGTNIGGAEVSTKLFVDEMIKKNIDIEVITANHDAHSNEVKIHKIPFFKAYPKPFLVFDIKLVDFILYRQIRAILKSIKPDILHIQEFELSYPAIRAAKSLGIKTLITVRDHRFICNLPLFDKKGEPIDDYSKQDYIRLLKELSKQRYGTKMLAYILYHWLKNKPKRFSYAAKNCDLVIAVSDYIKNLVISSGIDKERVKTIYNLTPSIGKIRRFSKSRKDDKKYLIFAPGRLEKYKGFHVLLEAASKIDAELELVIAGDGTYSKELKELAKQLNISDKVKFTGKLPLDRIYGYYSAADMVVLPSLWAEPLSRVIWEAFTFKVPLIATDTGGTPELVKDRKTGLLVEPNNNEKIKDAIELLMKDNRLRKKISSNAVKFIKSHNKRQLDSYISAYRRLMK